MSSDEQSDKECPLCMEPFDEVNFYPCTCHYQICTFCWHRLRTDENGLCPACRQPYPEQPVNYQPLSFAEIRKIKNEKKQKQQHKAAAKSGASEVGARGKLDRQHLSVFRVLQRNLVYVVGLSQRLADAELLKKQEYFGKFGKILKIAVGAFQPPNNSNNNASSNSGNNNGNNNQPTSYTAYVTYGKMEEALRAIQSVNNIIADGRLMRASLGTTKYCSNFLKGQNCHKQECMYLHEIADDELSFTKDDMHQGKHTEYERKLHEHMLNQTHLQQQQQLQQSHNNNTAAVLSNNNGSNNNVANLSANSSANVSTATTTNSSVAVSRASSLSGSPPPAQPSSFSSSQQHERPSQNLMFLSDQSSEGSQATMAVVDSAENALANGYHTIMTTNTAEATNSVAEKLERNGNKATDSAKQRKSKSKTPIETSATDISNGQEEMRLTEANMSNIIETSEQFYVNNCNRNGSEIHDMKPPPGFSKIIRGRTPPLLESQMSMPVQRSSAWMLMDDDRHFHNSANDLFYSDETFGINNSLFPNVFSNGNMEATVSSINSPSLATVEPSSSCMETLFQRNYSQSDGVSDKFKANTMSTDSKIMTCGELEQMLINNSSPPGFQQPSSETSRETPPVSSGGSFFLDLYDDLGFDPFSESSKALADMLEEEKTSFTR